MASRSTQTTVNRRPRAADVGSWPLALACAAALAACGPIISDEDGEGAAVPANAVGVSATGAAPVPGCAVGEQTVCACAGDENGVAWCGPDGAFGTCDCEDGEASGGGTSTGSGASEESGSSGFGPGSTSVGPGECLPLDQPCLGDVFVETNADVEAIAMCSRIEGSLLIIGTDVTDLSPLSCLRELGNQLYLEHVSLVSLAGLSNLQHIEGELEILWTRLVSLDLESLESTGYFSLYQNDDMVSLGVPNLASINGDLDVNDNPLLSTCEVESLVEDALSPKYIAFYQGNADDCPSSE